MHCWYKQSTQIHAASLIFFSVVMDLGHRQLSFWSHLGRKAQVGRLEVWRLEWLEEYAHWRNRPWLNLTQVC